MVNLKHLSKSCWNHLASWPYWKTLLHRRRWREGYIRRGTCACAACESEVLTEKSPDVSSHTTWTMYAFPRNGKLYDGFSSSGVWKFHVKDTVLKRSSFWSLAKRTRKRGTGFAFFGRELPSGCHPKLFTSFRVGTTEIMAALFMLRGTQRELEPSLHAVMFGRNSKGSVLGGCIREHCSTAEERRGKLPLEYIFDIQKYLTWRTTRH